MDNVVFWIVLGGIVGALFAASIVINQYLMDLRERVPEWAKAYGPAAYQHAMTGFNAGIGYLNREADKTTTPLDDKLVKVVDEHGRELLVKAAAIVGYVPDDTTKELPTAETDAGFSG